MEPEFQQQGCGLMVYPAGGWRKALFKAPLWLWRMGLGAILGRFYLVLTTTGWKSHQPRHTVLEFSVRDGRAYISPGWGRRTIWYRNILADPRVTAERAGRAESAIAVHVTAEEELAQVYRQAKGTSPVWQQWLESWGVRDEEPDFIAAHKDRLITLRLDPTTDKTPPPLRADLVWVWPLLLLVAMIAYHTLFGSSVRSASSA